MKMSVLVSCHNYRDFVVEAIESALAQSLPPSEIIVVDDGSTDGSGELLEATYAGHKIVRIIRTENRGQLATFVAGFQASSGNILVFLDADDRFRPGYFEKLGDFYSCNPSVGQVFCNMLQFGNSTDLWLPIRSDEDLGTAALKMWAIQKYYGVPTSGVSIRRSLGEKILTIPESFYPEWRTRADDFLVYGAALLGAHRYYLGEPLIDYRMHGANSWAGKRISQVQVMQHRYHLNKVIGWYSKMACINRWTLKWAAYEFQTKPKPRPGDLLLYLWLQLKAPMPPREKLIAFGQIATHYLLSLWKVKYYLRRIFPRKHNPKDWV